MAETLLISRGASRAQIYQEVMPQIEAIIQPENDEIANLANISAILKEAFDFFWVGFYRWDGKELVLGPFQGPLACTRIELGQGVCGTSALNQESIVVPDVDKFPGHIACSALSRSEVVVPLVVEGETKLILDVDSDKLDDFSDLDRRFLEGLMYLIGKRHYSLP